MSLKSVAIPLPDAQALFNLSVSFGSFSDLVVLSAECQTGGKLVRGTAYPDEQATAKVVLGTQWEEDRLLVLHLTGFKRMDIRYFGVYSCIEAFIDENGFRLEFPDGAVISSREVAYEFIAY